MIYDKGVAGSSLIIGDRVWLYIPAVKQGRTRKLASLWRGPYTIIDRVGAVNYRIQLIGSSKTLVVHRNRLKLCYGEPEHRRQPKPSSQKKQMSTQGQLPVTLSPQPTYAEVVATCSATVGGYTCSSDELLRPEPQPIRQPLDNHQATVTVRPQQNH